MNSIGRKISRIALLSVLLGMASMALANENSAASRNDATTQASVIRQLASKKEFHEVKSSVEDGIVTLTGSVDVYQQELDAAKKVRKAQDVQGVRNLIAVQGKDVPDAELTAQLDRKLYYDRMGYDIAFNYVTASVEDGVATLNGEARTEFDRDSALALVDSTAGVKDVVNNVKVSPVSISDDQIRLSAMRAIYRDPVLSRYAIDPARPIRIVVDRGTLSLYGTVADKMDKDIAGMRASQVFGAFAVKNNLDVGKKS